VVFTNTYRMEKPAPFKVPAVGTETVLTTGLRHYPAEIWTPPCYHR